jgi:hypothetical protein
MSRRTKTDPIAARRDALILNIAQRQFHIEVEAPASRAGRNRRHP